MKIIDDSIRYPVTTAVAVLLLALFGGISFFQIPIQLIPTVETPAVRIRTLWPGALPAEIERQIVQEQEEQLKSIEGLEEISSTSNFGRAEIRMSFKIGTDIDRALFDVSNRLQQVQRYPEEALKPQVQATSSEDQAIAWFGLSHIDPAEAEAPIAEMRDFMDDVVAPSLERVPGVAASNTFGGTRHQMHFYANPAKLASRKLTIGEVAAALSGENVSVSGGDFDEGKINFTVRTAGEYTTAEDVEDVVVAYRNDVPVFARDIGYAQLAFEKRGATPYSVGQEVIMINVAKAPGENLLEVMSGVKGAVKDLNEYTLEPQGLVLTQLTDQTEYVDAAISLLTDSVYVGAGLAILVLLLFLRSVSSTLIIAVAIPISVIGTVLMINLSGRSLNVISLAGVAFAIGMVVDNSIVALENIYRHREMGKSARQAASDGTGEVWGAILASTLTTVAVFLPILFIQQEAGQMFRDIAIAISAAVSLSMIVAVTVIPSLAARVMGDGKPSKEKASRFSVSAAGDKLTSAVAGLVYWICGGTLRRLTVTLGFTAAALYGAFQLTPQLEYMPAGNANAILGNLALPSSYNRDMFREINEAFEAEFAKYRDCDPTGPNCPGGGIRGNFFVALGTGAFFGASAKDPERVKELIPVLRGITTTIPAVVGGFRQASLFQRGPSGGQVALDIVGPDFERLQELGAIVLERMQKEVPNAQARPTGGLDRGKPEVRIIPHRLRASQLGVSSRELGVAVNALVDGAKVSDYQWQGKRIDLMLVADEGWRHRTQDVGSLPIVARDGKLVTLDTVARVELTSAPISITHRERQRASTILVSPPPGEPLQQVLADIGTKVIQPLTSEGILDGGYRIIPRGAADKLAQAWEALNLNLAFAVVITYLLMAALFQSFGYPLVIMLSVPLAGFGGLLGLDLMNEVSYQPLDVLTMLGFFILVGTVVNNAILLVHQALNHIRSDELGPREAIRESTRTRIRPIFMSVLTSVFGMAPLILYPGAGSELYRGIGSVVVGGLLVSTVFTLLLVPAMLSLFFSVRAGLGRMWGRIGAAQPAGD